MHSKLAKSCLSHQRQALAFDNSMHRLVVVTTLPEMEQPDRPVLVSFSEMLQVSKALVVPGKSWTL